jgi:chromatin remodeling complex protein RSC6
MIIVIKMAKKSVKSDDSNSVSVSEDSSAVAVAAPKKSRGKKAVVVPDTVSESVTETVSETKGQSKTPKTRQTPSRDTVEKEFNDLIAVVDAEVEKLRTASSKSKGVKFLRTINKNLKTLKTHALRLSKQKTTTRRVNNNSGLNKPVGVSKELAKFLGSDPATSHSRKDVTKFFCEYIKQNNLQLPTDKRIIMVDKDPKLKALLKYDGKDSKPLTLFSLQSYLKTHYVPSSSTGSVASTVSASSTVGSTASATPAPAKVVAKKATK